MSTLLAVHSSQSNLSFEMQGEILKSGVKKTVTDKYIKYISAFCTLYSLLSYCYVINFYIV